MASLNELAFNIRNKLTGGRSTNNEYISLDQVKFNIDYYRSLLIHRDLKKTVLEDSSFYQFIPMETEEVDPGLYKTVDKVPALVRLDHRYAVRIYQDDTVYPVIDYNRLKFTSSDKYTPDAKYAYFLNGYLYIQDDLNTINVMGIFESPSKAYIASGEDPEEVDDFHYPISGDMAQRISQSIINGDLEIMLQIAPDTTADNLPNRAMARE